MSNDISLSPVGFTSKLQIQNKPPHLVIFEDFSKGKVKKLVSIDKPDGSGYFVQVKGVICDLSESEIQSSYQDILTEAPKDSIVELLIPWSKIFYIRNLVFKAK